MDQGNEIFKAAGVIVSQRKLLVTRGRGKEHFIAPGGKLEPGETARQALVRELQEELQIEVREEDLTEFGKFRHVAAGKENTFVNMEVFTVKEWSGEIVASREVEEVGWITSGDLERLKVGSIFASEVVPRLKERGLID